MQYLLSHRTTYSYASSVDAAHHIAHLRARTFPGQKVTSIGILTQPASALAVQHVDHFGNLVDIYRIDQSHQRFDIEVRAAVEVKFPEPPPAERTPPWEEIRRALGGDGFPAPIEASEFVHDSPLVPVDEALGAYGARSLAPGRPILAAAYVSGYIRTVHSPEEIELRGADASHAWVAVWCGAAAGWVHLDPTNDLVAHEDHVAMAWGRDFSDVSPLRGVILGGGSHVYSVAVTLVPTG